MLEIVEDQAASVTIDQSGIVVACNQNVKDLFGYETNDLIGHNVHVLMPPPHRDKHNSYLARYLNGGIPKVIGHIRNVQARHRQGDVFPISLQVPTCFVVVIYDHC
jgi:two-component system sensor kinase FixL